MHYIILAKSNRNIHLLLLHYFIEWFVKYDIEEWWILKNLIKILWKSGNNLKLIKAHFALLIWKNLAASLWQNMVWNNSFTSRQDLKENWDNFAFSVHLISSWTEVTGFLSNKSTSLFGWLTLLGLLNIVVE